MKTLHVATLKNAMKTISVLIEQVDEWWIAQCLQCDLATQAPTLNDLHREIQRLIVAHIVSCEELGIEPFQVPPAPPEVWAKFERANAYEIPLDVSGRQPVPQRRPPAMEVRIYS